MPPLTPSANNSTSAAQPLLEHSSINKKANNTLIFLRFLLNSVALLKERKHLRRKLNLVPAFPPLFLSQLKPTIIPEHVIARTK
jgi:hypothetical protein